MRKSILLALPILSVLLPTVAVAAGAATGQQTVGTILGTVTTIFNTLIGLFITVALLMFFWGLIQYLRGASAENASEGVKLMLWGVVAMFVMVSIWGLVKLIQNTFGVTDTEIEAPKGFEYRPVTTGGVGQSTYGDE